MNTAFVFIERNFLALFSRYNLPKQRKSEIEQRLSEELSNLVSYKSQIRVFISQNLSSILANHGFN